MRVTVSAVATCIHVIVEQDGGSREEGLRVPFPSWFAVGLVPGPLALCKRCCNRQMHLLNSMEFSEIS